jgi:molybdopterin synthase sulfur carrier subunit
VSEPVRVKVTLTGAFKPWTQGGETFEFEVRNIKGVLRELDRLYPGLGEVLEEDTAVAVNGVLHEIIYTQVLEPGAEIYFIPKIESG